MSLGSLSPTHEFSSDRRQQVDGDGSKLLNEADDIRFEFIGNESHLDHEMEDSEDADSVV